MNPRGEARRAGNTPELTPGSGPAASRDPRSDLDLLRDHSAGDRQAFGELFLRHRDRLWATALRTMGDPEEAADALQDALVSACRAAAGFRGDSAVTTWMHRIVVNACLDRIRRRQARPTVPLPEVEPLPGRSEDRDTVLIVRQALRQLPEEQRAALVLVDMEGYSVADAAELLQTAQGTIKSRCSRGRARLAVILGHLRNPGGGGDVSSSQESSRTRTDTRTEGRR